MAAITICSDLGFTRLLMFSLVNSSPVLRFMRSQKVRHDWVTELNWVWYKLKAEKVSFKFCLPLFYHYFPVFLLYVIHNLIILILSSFLYFKDILVPFSSCEEVKGCHYKSWKMSEFLAFGEEELDSGTVTRLNLQSFCVIKFY